MAEKLKLILRRIHWSLLLRGFVFGAAWFYLLSWFSDPSLPYLRFVGFALFFVVALYLYFVPIPQSGTVAGPFFVLLLLAFLEPPSPLVAVIFAAVFFYILLVKDLILIDRQSAYEVTVLFLLFLLFLGFFERMGGSLGVFSLFYSFCGAIITGFLVWNFIHFAAPAAPVALPSSGGDQSRAGVTRIAVALSAMLMWQFLIVALFLPVDFVYQTVIAFLGAIFIVDLIPQYLFGEASREKVLVTTSILFILFVFVLGSARWGL